MDSELLFSGFLGSKVHLGVTGSVAAYRSLDILRTLLSCNCRVSATLTRAACRFVTPLSFRALGADPVYGEMFEDTGPFGHLEPGKGAAVLLVAPATADIIAKFAHGIADDMLSCQALAFPGPKVLAPAMNPRMWAAPATQANWKTLLERGFIGVGPHCGGVACGEEGEGRLAPLPDIVAACLRALAPKDMLGKRVLVSLGPTREAWDPVRFLSNASSGLMGACLAAAAWLRGAEVTVVAGPTHLKLVGDIRRIDVVTAKEMHEACMDLWPGMDAACMCAAVSDFRPEPYGSKKFKKENARQGLTMQLLPNPDILAAMGKVKRAEQALIGFAAETDHLPQNARKKLKAKNLDIIVANRIDISGSGFAAATNAVSVIDRNNRLEQWPQLPKSEVAWRIWDLLLQL